jgi:predicted  nucleic acid-binding Zn-ribbon protein
MTELRIILDYFGGVGALLVVGGVIIFLLNKMRNGSKLDNVHGGLYEQLKEQLVMAQAEIHTLKSEMGVIYANRNTLSTDVVRLMTRIEVLEECEESVATLKARLDLKDASLENSIIENRNLMREMLQLKDRIHDLEMRLSNDEAKFCVGCDRRATV